MARIDPRPHHVSKSAFARMIKLSPARVSQLIERGLPVEIDGRINPAGAIAWCRRNLDDRGRQAVLPRSSVFSQHHREIDAAAQAAVEGRSRPAAAW